MKKVKKRNGKWAVVEVRVEPKSNGIVIPDLKHNHYTGSSTLIA